MALYMLMGIAKPFFRLLGPESNPAAIQAAHRGESEYSNPARVFEGGHGDGKPGSESKQFHELPPRPEGENPMSTAIDNLTKAMERAAAIRPKVGGFPYLAESLRQAGVTLNVWSLPACQSLFLTDQGPVVMQGTPLVSGSVDVPRFDQEALITALRIDQSGNSTFPEFLEATWRDGVVRYEVNFAARSVAYLGCTGEKYVEAYPAVEIS
jgi:uncharacterized protein YbcV (DUF1398 family)